jgi:hypothetical protein
MVKLFCLFALLLFSTKIFSQSNIQLSCSFPKSAYLKGEKVEVGVYIKNIGSSPIEFGESSEVNVDLFNQSNELIPAISPTGYTIFVRLPIRLESNEEHISLIEFNRYYGDRFTGVVLDKFIEVGEYRAVINLHHNNNEFETTGSFDVIQPSDDELYVFNTWVDIMQGKIKFQNTRELVRELESLMDLYPNTVYGPTILSHIDIYYYWSLEDKDKAQSTKKKIIDN